MQDDSCDCIAMNTTNPKDLSYCQTGDITQIGKQSNHDGTRKDNNSAQDKDNQPNGSGIEQFNVELGIVKTKSPPVPLQACTSFRRLNATSNNTPNLTSSESNVEDNTTCCFQSCRTDHDCSEAEPEIVGVPEQQSVRNRHNATSGACRCYRAVRLGFLQCLEDTPFVVPGLVLTILFCVTIIVVIAATGRVS